MLSGLADQRGIHDKHEQPALLPFQEVLPQAVIEIPALPTRLGQKAGRLRPMAGFGAHRSRRRQTRHPPGMQAKGDDKPQDHQLRSL
jgi:hypothetical protein